jgi:hypothetical protein
MNSPWQKILDRPVDGQLVQFYGSDEEGLAVNVTKYIAEGLKRGEGAIVIATPDHVASFSRRLEMEEGFERIAWLDAEQTLRKFVSSGVPEWDRFEQTIVPAIQSVRGEGSGMRAYGEMVGLLWTAGKSHAAILLEQVLEPPAEPFVAFLQSVLRLSD